MTGFEVAFSGVMLLITAVTLLYLRHVVRTSGSDPINDPVLVKKFIETAPYHLLENPSADSRRP